MSVTAPQAPRTPASQRAEEAIIGAVFRDPAVMPEAVASMLEPEHFYYRPYRIVWEQLVERYYGDEPMDALIVAETVQKACATAWKATEREAVDRIIALRGVMLSEASTTEVAGLIKREADFRELLALSERLRRAVEEEAEGPEEIASRASAEAMRIATSRLMLSQTISFGEAGQRWVREAKRSIAAREAGIELGVKFGIGGIDDFTKGVMPSELIICGAPPGEGKSAVWWAAAQGYAMKQLRKPEQERIGTLLLSLEMGEQPSSNRLAQKIGDTDGEKIRTGLLTHEELMDIARKWARIKELPLYFNYSGKLRCAQLRAIISEEIRRHNIGVVVIDHFRFITPDDKMSNSTDADDAVVEALKVMAKELNIVVVCLAHTVKTIDRQDKRPRMSDLRGSGMISAFADFVCFVYRPYRYASESDRETGRVRPNEAEMIWEKSRHSGEGSGELILDLAKMTAA